VYEGFEDNPFLEAFYKDQERYALPTEMSFMVERYQQIQSELRQMDLFKRFVVSDYHLTKSLVFAANTLKENEFGLFKQVFDILFSKIPKPDAYIYLYRAPEELMANIQLRGRSYERDIAAEYLQNIHHSYMQFLKSQPDIPLKIIDVTGKDFKASRIDFWELMQQIFED
ncbi:MAG: deoxynucleoside kinase, partial [Flavobacteriaceae bacterium]|nr:deoxynucleoside kinase [Flavobacteriaceae bacterium]